MRTVVFADIAGHLGSFIHQAEKLGCSFTADDETRPLINIQYNIPEDLNIVFAGDVVHRGPHSDELLLLIDSMVHSHPRQVFVLVGNHEGNYLPQNPHPFSWSEGLSKASVQLLQRWWSEDVLNPSIAVDSTMGPLIITHAGLTKPFWEHIGSPRKPQDAHKMLMELKHSDDVTLWSPGEMMGFKTSLVGPIWAAANSELYSSWLRTANAPFGQVHGHSTSYQWCRSQFFGSPQVNPEIPTRTVLQRGKRISMITLGGKPFYGCDPDHRRKPVDDNAWAPLLLEHSRVLAAC